jgi:2-methylcitrate dehydratase PrpD
VVIPAALTVGADRGAPAAMIREAIAVGYETMVRFGVAFNGPTILYRGIWPTYFTAPVGVAAVTARLLGLDEKQAAHALALALVFASPGVAHPAGPRMARWLSLGHASRHGVMAALAAREGFTGDVQLMEKEFFSAIYAITPDIKVVAEGLGAPALAGVSLKPWCAARQTIAASQALKEMAEGGLKAEDVQAIRVSVPPPYLKMVNHGVVKGDRSSYLTSVPCQVALSLLDPGEQYALSPDPARITADVQALMTKVVVEADEGLLQHFPRTWPARVRVTTARGTQDKEMLHVPGDPARPFGADQAEHKFNAVLGRVIGEEASRGLWHHTQRGVSQDGGAATLLQEIGRAIG